MSKDQIKKPEIIVLTQFGKRDRDAADKALELARRTGAGLHLFHCFSEVGKYTLSGEYGRSLEQSIKKEEKRLKSTAAKNGSQMVDVNSSVLAGELSESICGFLKGRNVQMVVMGGRPWKNGSDYFCTDVTDIIKKISCPVLVVPEGGPKLEDE